MVTTVGPEVSALVAKVVDRSCVAVGSRCVVVDCVGMVSVGITVSVGCGSVRPVVEASVDKVR